MTKQHIKIAAISEWEGICRKNLAARDIDYIEGRIEGNADDREVEAKEYGAAEGEALTWYTALRDLEELSIEYRDRKCVARVLACYVAGGTYAPISEEDAREACRSGLNIRMAQCFPKLNGQRYEFVGHPTEQIP